MVGFSIENPSNRFGGVFALHFGLKKAKLCRQSVDTLFIKVLIEIQSTRDPASSFFGERGRANLVTTLLDLFAGEKNFLELYPRHKFKNIGIFEMSSS